VATGLGVFLGLSPQVILLALGLFALTFAISRIVSLASLVATGATPILLFLLSYPKGHVWAGILIASLIIIRHHENIVRLLKGQEQKFSLNKSPSSAA
jgi:glycerol-3-phosphate acyltransferase PlsY